MENPSNNKLHAQALIVWASKYSSVIKGWLDNNMFDTNGKIDIEKVGFVANGIYEKIKATSYECTEHEKILEKEIICANEQFKWSITPIATSLVCIASYSYYLFIKMLWNSK